MDLNVMSSEKYNLNKLGIFLNYELSSSLLLFFWYVWSVTLFAAIVAAVIFIPYMLFIFYKEKKIAWFISFCVVVVIPGLICMTVGSKVDIIGAFGLIPLALFYCYCVILRYLVNKRLNIISAREHLEANTLGQKQQLYKAKENVDKMK